MTDTWRRNVDRIQLADKARIDLGIQLKRITLEQAEALWAYRLKPLHSQAHPQPTSPIFPLTRQTLEQKFPGGKTTPRYTFQLGRDEYQRYKIDLVRIYTPTSPNPPINPPIQPIEPKIEAEFQLQWQDEYNKVQGKITKITLLSAPELIRMLEEALSALQVQDIKPKLLSGKFASYSLSYPKLGKRERVGVVWTEDANMTSFYSVMNACQKVINSNLCQTIYLIREAGVGNSKLAGNKLYRQIFTGSEHHHIKPTLVSVHYLATYHSLVNSALAGELVVGGKTLSLEQLKALIRESKILAKCTLLQDLGIVKKPIIDPDPNPDLGSVKEFLLNLTKTQGYLAKNILIENSLRQFSQVTQFQVEELIQQLCQTRQIQLINPDDPPKEHLIYFVPQS